MADGAVSAFALRRDAVAHAFVSAAVVNSSHGIFGGLSGVRKLLVEKLPLSSGVV